MGLDVNLTKQDNSTNVSITKGATQKSINDALVATKVYRDEASTFATNASDSAGISSLNATSSSNSASSSLASANKAYKWAEEAEDVEVETGEYSAKHWAIKAQGFASGTAKTVNTIVEMEALTSPTTGDTVIVKDLDRGGIFVYDSTEVINDNQGTNFNGWIRQFDGVVNVKWFGAKGDGVTDDTEVFQLAFNTYDNIFIPKGIYVITSQILVEKNISITGENGTIIDLNSSSNTTDIFSFVGGGATLLGAITTDINSGNEIINESFLSSVSEGDLLAIHNPADRSYNAARYYYNASEFIKVLKKKSSTEIITSPRYASYLSSSTINIYKMDMINVTIKNLTFNGNETTTVNERVLNLTHCENSHIENVNVNNAGLYSGITVTRSYNVTIDKCQTWINKYGNLAANAYPILISNCQSLKITNSISYSLWHALAIGGGAIIPNVVNRDVRVDNCSLIGTTSMLAADMHGNVEYSTYSNNTIRGGITMGGDKNSFIGNNITIGVTLEGSSSTLGECGLCFYNSEARGLDFTIANNTVNIYGWYASTGFGQFVHFVTARNSDLVTENTDLATGTFKITSNNVHVIGISGVNDTGRDFIKIVKRNENGYVAIDISGNTFRTKYNSEARIRTYKVGGVDFESVKITDNLMTGIGLSNRNAKLYVEKNNLFDMDMNDLTTPVSLYGLARIDTETKLKFNHTAVAGWKTLGTFRFDSTSFSYIKINIDTVSDNGVTNMGNISYLVGGYNSATSVSSYVNYDSSVNPLDNVVFRITDAGLNNGTFYLEVYDLGISTRRMSLLVKMENMNRDASSQYINIDWSL